MGGHHAGGRGAETQRTQARSVFRDSTIDGKVSVYSSHLVFVSLNDADDGVIDDRAYCSDSSIFFPLTKMFFNCKFGWTFHVYVNSKMSKATDQGPSRPFNCNNTGFYTAFNPIGYVHRLFCVQDLHFLSFKNTNCRKSPM